MAEETTETETPKKKRGMSKIEVVPKHELDKEQLRAAFEEYEELQTQIKALDAQRAELKKSSAELVRAIVEDQGKTHFTVNGKLYKPGRHGDNYFFTAPDIEAVDLDA
jgi:predicted transcriptional regulator